MGEARVEKATAPEMLSYGGVQFSASIYMAFTSYYLMMFLIDIALIPAAVTAVLLVCYRIFSALDTQVIAIFINRSRFKDGKYRPYYKWCALPFAAGLAALGMTPVIGAPGRVVFAAAALIICDLSWSTIHMASISLLPYLARDDVSRSKLTSFSNGSSILAFILVGSFMLPIADFLGSGDKGSGFSSALGILALITLPLIFNAYFRLKEHSYMEPKVRPAIKDVFFAILSNRRVMLFLSGLGLYFMADAFKNVTTLYYMTHVMGRSDLLPVVILAGLLSPLAMQPVIPRLLRFARKEVLIVIGLFSALCASLLMLAAGTSPVALICCVVLYGVFTSIVANLVFAVMASLTDDIRERQNISMSEMLAATMNLSSNIAAGVAGGAAALTLGFVGYLPPVMGQAVAQPDAVLAGIRVLYIVCTAAGMALAGAIMLLFRNKSTKEVTGHALP